MKKQVLSLVASLGMCGGLMAQNQIETYSVYDVNHQDGVTVADATRVVSRAIEQIQDDPQVVDASVLNALLLELKSEIQQVNTRLSAIEDKLGIENDGEDTPNIHNGHEYVDLGLPSGLKWATCNVGATNPEDYGDYFAWGETEPYYIEGHAQDTPCSNWKTGKTGYNWESYKWCNGDYNKLTKYCNSSSHGTIDDKTILEAEDDAARQNWGGSWRMPTWSEIVELDENCDWTWTELNSVNGFKVTGPNSNWIFLPAAGYRSDRGLSQDGSFGRYWSSSMMPSYPNTAFELFFDDNIAELNSYSSIHRYFGQSVRPVTE